MGKDHAVPRDSTNSSYNKQQFFPKLSEIILSGMLSCVWLFVTPWTIICQAPLSMECSRQEYWSGLPFPTPGDLPNPGFEAASLASSALADRFFYHWAIWKALWYHGPIKFPKIWEYLAELCFILLSANIKKIPLSLSFYIKNFIHQKSSKYITLE